MKIRHRMLVTGLICAAAACAAEPNGVPMQEPVAYPHVGVALSLPKGFSPTIDSDPFLIVRAVREQGEGAVQAVTLSAYPVEKKVTTEDYADAMAEQLAESLAIRKLKVLKKTSMPVAGVTGSAARMSYEYRGVPTVAARLYFIREGKNGKVRICYVLTVESTPQQEKTLLSTLSSVIKSMKFVPVQDPATLPVAALGPAIEDRPRGYAIRPPRGWFAGTGPAGVFMGQTSYLRGAEPTVMLSVVTASSPAEATHRAVSEANLKRALAEAAKRKLAAEVLANGPATMGKRPCHQFVLRQAKQPTTSTRQSDPEPPIVIVQRTACLPRPAKKTACTYSLVLICQGADPAKARAIMAGVAAGFKVLPPPPPATSTAPTQPTTSTAPAPAAEK